MNPGKSLLTTAVFSAMALFCSIVFCGGASAARLIDSVDPVIGTGGEGFSVGSISPGPSMPFERSIRAKQGTYGGETVCRTLRCLQDHPP